MENKQSKEVKMVSIKGLGDNVGIRVIQSAKDGQPLRVSNNLIILSSNKTGFRHIKPYNKIISKVIHPKKTTTVNKTSIVPPRASLAKTLAPLVQIPSSSLNPKTENKVSPNTKISSKRKGIFSKELRCMLYGFGDENPYAETVDMVEDLVLKFIGDISLRALNVGAQDRISTEDLMFVLRKDPKKYSRLKELELAANELRFARRAFDEDKFICEQSD